MFLNEAQVQPCGTWCELDELEKDFKKRTATISAFAPQFEMMHAEYKIARLHAILDPCIQRTTRFLRSQGHSGELRLRPGYNKGLQLCFKKRERYLIADTTHTLGFVDSGGNIREYLVIMVDNTPQWLKGETLRAYMAIVHQQRKKRGESNCVVYGVHTNTEFFDFFKIDSASKVSTLYNKETSRFWFYPFGQGKDPEAALATRSEESREGYKRLFWNAATQSWRVYMNFTEDVVTLFENILDDGVQDCYGISFTQP